MESVLDVCVDVRIVKSILFVAVAVREVDQVAIGPSQRTDLCSVRIRARCLERLPSKGL